MKHLTMQDLIDRAEIREVLMKYAHGMDRLDDDMLRSVFWSDAVVVFPANRYQGDVQGFIDKFLLNELHGGFSRTQHFIGNMLIEKESDTVAYVESYMMANYDGTDKHDEWANKHISIWGRFIQRFEKRNDEWRIAEHRLLLDWQRDDKEGGWYDLPEDQLGRRDGTDPAETHERWDR